MFIATDKPHVQSALAGKTKLRTLPLLIEEVRERQSRGFVYQITSSFETALADHEFSLQVALATGDQWVIWQGLMHSAIALASREQQKAGDYFRAALELARVINDPLTLAHSLNRMGSWLTRIDRPREGIALHKEAFTLLEQMNEQQEVARTLDALGNSYACMGDLKEAVLHYRNAAILFRSLGDALGLLSVS